MGLFRWIGRSPRLINDKIDPCLMFRVEVSSEDVVLEGGASGSKISISLTAQGNTEIVLTGAKQRHNLR